MEPAPWEVEEKERQQVEIMRLKHALDNAVDDFLATGLSPALLQIELTGILATDLIVRQEGIMEMIGSRHDDEDEGLTWENYRG